MSQSRPRCVCFLIVCACVCVLGIFLWVYVRKCVHSGIVVCSGVNLFVSIADIRSLMHLRVEFVLEDVQVVGGGDGDDVLGRVPGCMEDLLGEVQAVHTDVVLPALSSSRADSPRLQDRSGFAAFSRCLQGHVAFGVPVEHAEEVVVGSGHNHAEKRKRREQIRYCSLEIFSVLVWTTLIFQTNLNPPLHD